MKKLSFILFLILSFNSYAATVTLSDKECNQIAVESGVVAFSSDNNLMLFLPYKLNKGVGAKYMEATKKAVDEKLKNYCKDSKGSSTLEGFKKVFHETCGSQCSENTKLFDKSFLSVSKSYEESDTVCLSLCNKTYGRLEALEQGARLTSKESKDCTGAVESTSRSNTKEWTPMKGKLPLMAAPVQPR